MATPGAPANIAVSPADNPGEVKVVCDAVTADPVVTSYTCYIHPQTGVSTGTFSATKTSVKPIFKFLNKHQWRKVFAVVTATNSEATGSAGTEASGKARV